MVPPSSVNVALDSPRFFFGSTKSTIEFSHLRGNGVRKMDVTGPHPVRPRKNGAVESPSAPNIFHTPLKGLV